MDRGERPAHPQRREGAQVVSGLAPPWTSRISEPSPSRVTEIALTARGRGRATTRAFALREIRASLAALDSRPLGDPLHFTLLYLRWVTPGASTARTCSSCT